MVRDVTIKSVSQSPVRGARDRAIQLRRGLCLVNHRSFTASGSTSRASREPKTKLSFKNISLGNVIVVPRHPFVVECRTQWAFHHVGLEFHCDDWSGAVIDTASASVSGFLSRRKHARSISNGRMIMPSPHANHQLVPLRHFASGISTRDDLIQTQRSSSATPIASPPRTSRVGSVRRAPSIAWYHERQSVPCSSYGRTSPTSVRNAAFVIPQWIFRSRTSARSASLPLDENLLVTSSNNVP